MKNIIYLLLFTLVSCNDNHSPDIIFWGGPILTVNQTNEVVEAVAIKKGTIIALGKKSDLFSLSDAHTQFINLKGDTLIPGFIGAHEHPTLTAVFSNTIDVSGFTFPHQARMWKHLKQEIQKSPHDKWIYAMGLDPVLMPDLELPTIQKLDAIAPNQPLVIISQTMHSFWANTKAFLAVGIDKHSKDPGNGSYYGKDASGELNGFISEADAAQPFLTQLKSPLKVKNRYEQTLKHLLKYGYTTVVSAGFNMPPWLAKYIASYHFKPFIRQFIYLTENELKYLPDSPVNGDDFYKILGIKIWYDGSPYTGTMALKTPYLNNPLTSMMGIRKNQKGKLRISPQRFSNLLKNYGSKSWQIAIHSQGDFASKQAFTQIKETLGNKANPLRIRFEHGLLIDKETLQGFKKYNLTPSFHINHIYYYGDALASKIIGEQRAQKILPLKSAFDLHLHPTIHADSPMFPTEPFSLMKTAVTRKTKTGKILGPDEVINVQQALRAMTINAAWQIHMETKIGSIENNKFADFTILSANPYQLNTSKWHNIKIKQVWVDGRQVMDQSIDE